MVGWHHWLSGHEFGWTPGVDDRQGGPACCDSWGCEESDTIEGLNWLTDIYTFSYYFLPPPLENYFIEILPAVQALSLGPFFLCSSVLLKWSREGFLFLHSLEAAMAKFGGGVNTLEFDLQDLLRVSTCYLAPTTQPLSMTKSSVTLPWWTKPPRGLMPLSDRS